MRGLSTAALILCACGHHAEPVHTANRHVEPGWRAHVAISIHLSNTRRLESFPVLVRLTPARVDFARIAADGHDLRFTDDAHVDLPYEIDRFDPKGTTSVWVRIPVIEPGRDTKLLLELDNPNAPYVAMADIQGVWSNGFAAVYHLENLEDSSPNKNGTGGGELPPADGKVAGARLFTPKGPSLSGPTEAFAFAGDRSVCAWANPDTVAPGSATIASYGGEPGFALAREGSSLRCGGATAAAALTAGTWRYLCCVHHAGGDTLYVDGVPSASTGHSRDTVAAGRIQLGAKWAGILDEIRLSNVARDRDWIAAEVETMTKDVATFGPVESQ